MARLSCLLYPIVFAGVSACAPAPPTPRSALVPSNQFEELVYNVNQQYVEVNDLRLDSFIQRALADVHSTREKMDILAQMGMECDEALRQCGYEISVGDYNALEGISPEIMYFVGRYTWVIEVDTATQQITRLVEWSEATRADYLEVVLSGETR